MITYWLVRVENCLTFLLLPLAYHIHFINLYNFILLVYFRSYSHPSWNPCHHFFFFSAQGEMTFPGSHGAGLGPPSSCSSPHPGAAEQNSCEPNDWVQLWLPDVTWFLLPTRKPAIIVVPTHRVIIRIKYGNGFEVCQFSWVAVNKILQTGGL